LAKGGRKNADTVRAHLAASRQVARVLALLQLLYMVAVTGLSTGAVATAYKLVTGYDGPSDQARASA